MLRSAIRRAVSPLYVGACSWKPIKNRLAPYLEQFDNCLYSPRGLGYGDSDTLRRLSQRGAIEGKDVLIVGPQYGTELPSNWLRHNPRRILGIDVILWPEQWGEISKAHPRISFAGMNAMQLGIASSSFDLVFSRAVLEHVRDVEKFFAGAHRVLRAGGLFHADFGPLWHTYGGPHIGALGFEHLRIPWGEYLEKARAIGNGWERWIEEGLFNHLRLEEYLASFTKYFKVEFLLVIGSPDAEKFKKGHPREWQELRANYSESDLMVRLVSMTGLRR
jgi:SAM-dependent methyltransferase